MKVYDIAVIGGGIQGAGVAQAFAAAGCSVIVFEQTGIASATSSKSSKLIHGGLRYLESCQFKLVRKALLERALLFKLAPTLVKPVKFFIPIYKHTMRRWWQIKLGLSLYQLLGGFKKYTHYKKIDITEQPVTRLRKSGLQIVYQYYDAQTDDVELTHRVMQSAQELGAEIFCPASVESLQFNKVGYDITLKNKQEKIFANVVVNAAGPWVNHVVDSIKGIATKKVQCELVQGTHIVIDAPSPEGVIYVEAPQDKRAVFIMPWKDKTLVGTTEKSYTGDPADVKPSELEINYLVEVYQHYMDTGTVNVLESFAGLRVLPVSGGSFFSRARDTVIVETAGNFISLYGGKLTAYRMTAEQVLKLVKNKTGITFPQECSTSKIKLD